MGFEQNPKYNERKTSRTRYAYGALANGTTNAPPASERNISWGRRQRAVTPFS